MCSGVQSCNGGSGPPRRGRHLVLVNAPESVRKALDAERSRRRATRKGARDKEAREPERLPVHYLEQERDRLRRRTKPLIEAFHRDVLAVLEKHGVFAALPR